METKTVLPFAIIESTEDGEIEGHTRYQKLVFLLQNESDDIRELYHFEPDKYGPYSRDLSQDLRKLDDEGLLNISVERAFNGSEKYTYRIGPQGREGIEDWISQVMEEAEELRGVEDESKCIVDNFNEKRLFDLLDYVYTHYPEMAKNSVV